ncbi:EEP domain-containing protein [Mesorhizobium sp. NBSH29]|uniref:endonuclease/exonuclease/phosphatase family protein n=1 Tax=Mesorhizobium sp. NBSH29 TaxID=2654249 RepID=UPI0018968A72|nr:endonuclease/exonuclease/phosphatase family protein [Mesorhizobium sp. NBSH29]QPC85492.1 EEP domain-containing protein [Mesorhizobium sp. NBSH29]
MRLVSYNIQYGFGADGRYDLARAAQVLAGADIIALQEVERHWRRSDDDDQPHRLASLLPDHFWVYGPAFDMDASRRENGRVVNRRRQFGTMLLSRFPIAWSRLHLLPMRRGTARLNTQNPALECLVETPAGPVRILSLHLAHIDAGERLEQLDVLLDLHRRAASIGGPWSGVDDETSRDWSHGELEPACPQTAIWMGDFNCQPDSAEYRRITEAADQPHGFVDAAVAAGATPEGCYTHLRTLSGQVQRRRLDYCFVSPNLASRVHAHSVDTAETASDHFPVLVDIDLEMKLPV